MRAKTNRKTPIRSKMRQKKNSGPEAVQQASGPCYAGQTGAEEIPLRHCVCSEFATELCSICVSLPFHLYSIHYTTPIYILVWGKVVMSVSLSP